MLLRAHTLLPALLAGAAAASIPWPVDAGPVLSPSPDAPAPVQDRDASTRLSGGQNNEGEHHGNVSVPKGSRLTSLPVGNSSDQAAVFWSTRSSSKRAEQAFVMIHGRTRNGNDYWQTMENALVKAVNDSYPGASNNSIVTAPQFFSTHYNSGQYRAHQLAWGDTNAWQAGEIASHPNGTNSSAFDVLDAFVQEFSNRTRYPQLKNLTLVGHGGGGQLMQRYAVVGRDPPSDLYVRYIYGDPSSSVYFTKHRPHVEPSVANKTHCPWYDHWRYGFTNFTDVMPKGGKAPIEYFAQYIQRDVVAMIGYKDTATNGDQYCMAKLQGGEKRRDRNLAYWKYINTLARTDFDMTGFNASYHDLPDWSNVSNHRIAHRLIVIEKADHDADLVFGSEEGRAALFSDNSTLPTGWRPKGWNPNGSSPRSHAGSGLGQNNGGSSTPSGTTQDLAAAGLWALVALAAGSTVLL